jgi:hypothetical protein
MHDHQCSPRFAERPDQLRLNRALFVVTVHHVGDVLSMTDRPEFKRAHDRHQVELTIDLGDQAGFASSSTFNVSGGGISIRGSYEVGDVVRVTFAVPQAGLLVHTEGRVVWTEVEQAGLVFDDLEPEARDSINEVLRARTPQV